VVEPFDEVDVPILRAQSQRPGALFNPFSEAVGRVLSLNEQVVAEAHQHQGQVGRLGRPGCILGGEPEALGGVLERLPRILSCGRLPLRAVVVERPEGEGHGRGNVPAGHALLERCYAVVQCLDRALAPLLEVAGEVAVGLCQPDLEVQALRPELGGGGVVGNRAAVGLLAVEAVVALIDRLNEVDHGAMAVAQR